MLRAQPGAAARRGSRRAETSSSGELRHSGLRARLPPAAGRAMPRDGRRHPRAPRAGHSATEEFEYTIVLLASSGGELTDNRGPGTRSSRPLWGSDEREVGL